MKACDHDINAGLKLFEAKRLPDVHALFELDLSALPRAGIGPWGRWDPRFWVTAFHMKLWGGLSKALPGLVGEPEIEQMSSKVLPYRKVSLWVLALVF